MDTSRRKRETVNLTPSANVYTTVHLHELRYAAALRQPMHAHDYTSLSFVARGEVEECAGGVHRRGSAGDVIVKPAGVLHDDRYGASGAAMFTLITDDHDAGPYRWLFGGAPAALFTRAILEWRGGAAYDEIAFDLLAATHDGAPRLRSASMREVAERVERTDVSVEALARELGMHPVALARAFRREHGHSITCHRRRIRVRRAAALLSDSASPLADVALESGFSDQSHLCRVFKSELGLTPSSFRALTV